MNLNDVKIVTDSSADITKLKGINFDFAPLKIMTSKKEYVDNKYLDVKSMVNDLSSYKGRSSTSCPNTEEWLEAFGEAKYVFCVTITGTLSGSYNSAVLAKNEYERKYNDRKVFVLDSLSAGPETALLIEKTAELLNENLEFEEIIQKLKEYTKQTGLLFMLESMRNLANNGRVSPITAKMAGLLGIRVVGKASDRGDLEPLDKCRGEQKAIATIVDHMKEMGLKSGKVKIAHCFNENAAFALNEMIASNFENVETDIYNCRGLCSFYAEKGGILVGFEKI